MKFKLFTTLLFLWLWAAPALAQTSGQTSYPAGLDGPVSTPQAADYKFTFLTAAATNSQTTLTVSSTTGFPDAGVLVVDAERIAYTGKTSTTFTGLTRGFDSTVAATHSANATVRTPITQSYVNGVRGAVQELEKKVGVGASDAEDAATDDVLTKDADGTTKWKAPSGGGGTPGGSSGAVQFNLSGALGGSSDFYWDNTNKRIGVRTTSPAANLEIRTGAPDKKGLIIRGAQATSDTEIQPDDVEGLKLWLKADALTGLSDGDTVTTWADSSGLGNDATQSDGSKKPIYKVSIINGKPVLRFDGVNDILATAAVANSNDAATVIIVAKVTTKTAYGHFVCYGTNLSGSWNFRQTGTTGRLTLSNGETNIGAGAINDSTPDGTTADLQGQGFKVLAGDVTSGNLWTIWENGGEKDTATETFTLSASEVLTVGGRPDLGFLNGDIAEVIVFNSALSVSNREGIQTYLGNKYGITITNVGGIVEQSEPLAQFQNSDGDTISSIGPDGLPIFNLVTQPSSNGSLGGTIALSSATSNSLTFPTAYNSAPACTVTPEFDLSTTRYWVTKTASALTVNTSAAVTGSFAYTCVGNPN